MLFVMIWWWQQALKCRVLNIFIEWKTLFWIDSLSSVCKPSLSNLSSWCCKLFCQVFSRNYSWEHVSRFQMLVNTFLLFAGCIFFFLKKKILFFSVACKYYNCYAKIIYVLVTCSAITSVTQAYPIVQPNFSIFFND